MEILISEMASRTALFGRVERVWASEAIRHGSETLAHDPSLFALYFGSFVTKVQLVILSTL